MKILVKLERNLFFSVVFCDISCSNPLSSNGEFVGESHECVALVKAKCKGLLNISAEKSWKRGRNVRDNCTKIAKFTAVATFTAPNNKFKGHAAIFESCATDGVWVWDQYTHPNQPTHLRKMKFGDNTSWPSNDGSALYTVEI